MGQYNSPWANALDEAEDELLRLASYVSASNKNKELTRKTTLRAQVTNAINAANSDSSLAPGVMPMIQDYVAKTGDHEWASTQQQAHSNVLARQNKTRRALANANDIRTSLDAIDPLSSSGNGDGGGTKKIMSDVDNATQTLDDLHKYDAANRLRQDLKQHNKEYKFYQNTMKQYDYTANEILKDGTITEGVNAPGWQIDPGNPNAGTLEKIKFHIQNKDTQSAKTEIANMKAANAQRVHLGTKEDKTPKMGTLISRDHAYERDPNNNMRYVMSNGRPVLKEGVIENDIRYPGKFIRLDDGPTLQKSGEIRNKKYTGPETNILNASGLDVRTESHGDDYVTDINGNTIPQNDASKVLNAAFTDKQNAKSIKDAKVLDEKNEKERRTNFDSTMNQKYEDLHTIFESGPMKVTKNADGKWAAGTDETMKDMYNESKVLYKIMKNKDWHGNDKHTSIKKIEGIQENIETYIQEIFEAHDSSSWYQDDYDINSTLVDTYNNKGGGLSGAKGVLASQKFANAAGHSDPTEAANKLANLFDFYGAKITNPGDSKKSLAQAQALVRMYRIWEELELERMRRQKRAIDLGGGGTLP